MTLIAGLAVVLAVVRPGNPSPASQRAARIIEAQVPGFEANRYRVVEEVKSRDGRFVRVRFRGVDGTVQGDELSAVVPAERVLEGEPHK